MLETFVILFRESLEAFLIVAIMLSYVTNTGRKELVKPIYFGVITALIISATTGWHIAGLAQDPLWEGSLAIIAAIFVMSFTIYVMKNASNIHGDIHKRLETTTSKTGPLAVIGIFSATVLMVSREGMETALMLGTISASSNAMGMTAGAIMAIALVCIVAYLWATQSAKINLKLFMQVTGVFLMLFSAHLLFYGFHELSEMLAIPFIGEENNLAFHHWSEPIESPLFSTLSALGLICIPLGWLGFSFLKDKKIEATA